MQECPVIISIDVKKGRIRLYKSMLGLLEKPDYVQILINIKKKEIAVLSVKKSLDAHRFRYSSRNCCELYSRSLVDRICLYFPEMKQETYQLAGVVLEGMEVAVFSMSTLEKIEGGELSG